MNADSLFDTNVVVYAVSRADEDTRKSAIALQLIGAEDFGLSGQVVAEFYNTVTRKIRIPLDHDVALDWIEQLEEFPCVPVDASLVYQGAEIARRHKTSYWDGAILAAAERLGAHILYTEDLNHGQFYGAVQVINPFLEH